MAYTISIYKEYENIILDFKQIINGKTKKFIQLDDEREIKEYLDGLVSRIKSVKYNDKDDNMFVSLEDNANMTILGYTELQKYRALIRTRRKIQDVYNKNKIKKIALTFGLGIPISSAAFFTIKAKVAEAAPKTNISIEEVKDEKLEETLLNKNSEEKLDEILEEPLGESLESFLSGLNVTLLDSANLDTVITPDNTITNTTTEELNGTWTTLDINNLAQYIDIENIGRLKDGEKKINVETYYQDIVKKYCDLGGIDSELIMALLAQERGYHSTEIDDGGAIGIAQIQVSQHKGNLLSFKNYQTGEIIEIIDINDNTLKDLETNIKIGIAIFLTHLDYFEGNRPLALQAYNFGRNAVDTCLDRCVERTGFNREFYINNPDRLDWLYEVAIYSEENKDEDGNLYGDPNYIEHVFDHINVKDGHLILYWGKDGKNQSVYIPQEEKSQTR